MSQQKCKEWRSISSCIWCRLGILLCVEVQMGFCSLFTRPLVLFFSVSRRSDSAMIVQVFQRRRPLTVGISIWRNPFPEIMEKRSACGFLAQRGKVVFTIAFRYFHFVALEIHFSLYKTGFTWNSTGYTWKAWRSVQKDQRITTVKTKTRNNIKQMGGYWRSRKLSTRYLSRSKWL